ncbi:TetR/AcrR family transcriptional regulator [Micromonospora sp. WMMD1102]|uniref:TetR/AcrR family transcriptional regulator n=1 Tax=Micromonospora sp. WMMD1102 TaxID=3016105 RepID=UPI002414D3FE|nr:TetR/AcrR family transcriptional regulator [Micromonospora sp. WMMD1102]MDG4786723.1 TetR/AcrR family transcriptional regulator [Micromonospora sp. WMMD1102]
MNTKTTAGPRERLLAAAKELTYQQGTAVGVDALLKAANVARRSLYEHFGGKDGLIAEVLRVTAAEDEAAYEQAMRAAGSNPRERLLAIFDWLDEVIQEPGFRGCRYLAADLALADPDHPGHAVTRRYNERIREILERELNELGHPRPALAADQLVVLINGALAIGAMRPHSRPALAARQLADQMLSGDDKR